MLSLNDYTIIKLCTLCVNLLGFVGAAIRCHTIPVFDKRFLFYLTISSLFFVNFLSDFGIVTITYFNPLFVEPVKSLVFNSVLVIAVWFMAFSNE